MDEMIRGPLPLLFTCLCVLLAAPNLRAAPGTKCVADAQSDVINLNARIPAQEYTAPNHRTVYQYDQELDISFAIRRSRLGPGSVFFDIGGGYGIAGLETAAKGARIVVINAQENWSHFEELVATNRTIPVVKIAHALHLNTSDLPITKRTEAGVSGPVVWLDDSLMKPEHRRTLARRIVDLKTRREVAGRFEYRVGFAEKVLPTLQEKADLISDLFGAYYYSANRLELLDLYLNALKPGGLAAIRLRSQIRGKDGKRAGPESRVRLPGGEESLEQHLVRRFPGIFRFNEDETVLYIRREAGTVLPQLTQHYRLASHQFRRIGLIEVPDVEIVPKD